MQVSNSAISLGAQISASIKYIKGLPKGLSTLRGLINWSKVDIINLSSSLEA